MLFFRKRTNASASRIAIMSSVALVAAAVWAWDVPMETVGHYFLVTLLLLGGLIVLAAITVLVIKGLKKLLRKP